MDFLVPLLAQDAGLFKEQGVDVDVSIATAPPTLLPAVIGGSLQIGVSTGVQVAAASQAGLDVVIVAGGGTISKQDANTAIVVAPDSPLQQPKDFVGKRVVGPRPEWYVPRTVSGLFEEGRGWIRRPLL